MELDKFKDVDLVLDKSNDNFIAKQAVSHGDYLGRTLTVQITNGGLVGALPGAQLVLHWKNIASGLSDDSAYTLIDAENTIFRIEYPQNMLTPGTVKANILVIYQGKTTVSREFEITVANVAGQSTGVLAKAEFSALVSVLSDANKFVVKDTNEIISWGMLDQTAKDKILGVTPSAQIADGDVTTSKVADAAITADKTDFLKLVKQFLSADESTANSYWYFSGAEGSTVGITSGTTGFRAYSGVYLPKGSTVSILNAKLFFSGAVTTQNKKIIRFSDTDTIGDYEYTATQDCYILVTDTINTNAKAINLPKNKITDTMYDAQKGTIATYLYDVNLSQSGSQNSTTINVSTASELLNAINSIKDSSKANKYTIKLKNVTYDLYAGLGGETYLSTVESATSGEMFGLNLPDYVDLVCDDGIATLTLIIPDDKATLKTSTRISPLSIYKNHMLENIEIIGKNTRYAIHDETGNGFSNLTRKLVNVTARHLGNKDGLWSNTQAYAAGTGSGGTYEFDNCQFISVRSAFSMHDNTNQKSNKITINNCSFESGSDYDIRFGTYGSGSELHDVTITNSRFSKYLYVMEEMPNSGAGMRFNVSGGGNSLAPYYTVNSGGDRLPIKFSDETSVVTNVGDVDLVPGDLVTITDIGKVKKITTSDNYLFCGFVLESIKIGESGVVKTRGYVSRDDCGLTSLPAVGTRLGIVSGKLATTTSSDYVAIVTHWRNILIKF